MTKKRKRAKTNKTKATVDQKAPDSRAPLIDFDRSGQNGDPNATIDYRREEKEANALDVGPVVSQQVLERVEVEVLPAASKPIEQDSPDARANHTKVPDSQALLVQGGHQSGDRLHDSTSAALRRVSDQTERYVEPLTFSRADQLSTYNADRVPRLAGLSFGSICFSRCGVCDKEPPNNHYLAHMQLSVGIYPTPMIYYCRNNMNCYFSAKRAVVDEMERLKIMPTVTYWKVIVDFQADPVAPVCIRKSTSKDQWMVRFLDKNDCFRWKEMPLQAVYDRNVGDDSPLHTDVPDGYPIDLMNEVQAEMSKCRSKSRQHIKSTK